ncbi:MAG: PHP domain-containing protein [Bacteroidales bacterium]|nr:PHP domain-containing protein [Bacteroidales bacterium]MDD4293356.1 PHP domain-containing protein [Bacteroidales bacterium]
MKRNLIYPALLLIAFLCCSLLQGQSTKTNLNPNKVTYPSYGSEERSTIIFPKVMGYEVVTCDFHTHTMFSDGLVWPSLRVSEAWTEGLDAIAITDHIEYRPHRKLTVNDHNTSYTIAKEAADAAGFMLIKGTEITRTQKTLGHFNALFIQDANPIDTSDAKASIREAKKQGAFIIWNHPGWAVDSTYIKEFQEDLFREGLIDGIEVFNNTEFYPRVLAWAVEKGLTVISASDAHGSIEKGVLAKEGIHRPMTLVLASERTLAGIREALDKGRTLAYFHNTIAGREVFAKGFVNASIKAKLITKKEKSSDYLLTNLADFTFKFSFGKKKIELPALSSIIITVPNNPTSINLVFGNIFINENQLLAHDLQL